MSSPNLVIRAAESADVPTLLEIYNDAVLGSNAVWTEATRSLEEQHAWLAERTGAGYPVFVATRMGRVAGYTTYGAFRSWPGYRHTMENSVFIASTERRRGVGEALLHALIAHARAQGVHVLIAGIDGENTGSLRLHEKLGYVRAAHLHEVGIKHGRWLDLILLEKRL